MYPREQRDSDPLPSATTAVWMQASPPTVRGKSWSTHLSVAEADTVALRDALGLLPLSSVDNSKRERYGLQVVQFVALNRRFLSEDPDLVGYVRQVSALSRAVASRCRTCEMNDQKIAGCCQGLSVLDQWPSMNIRSPLRSLAQRRAMRPLRLGDMNLARRAPDMARAKKARQW